MISALIQRFNKAETNPQQELDPLLLWSSLGLLMLGFVMVYSASIATAEGSRITGNQAGHFLIRHGIFLAISIVCGVIAFQIPLRFWQQMAPWLFLIGMLMLVIVIMPGIGRSVNGAQRWLPLGAVNLQPSEMMKLFAVLYAADYTN